MTNMKKNELDAYNKYLNANGEYPFGGDSVSAIGGEYFADGQTDERVQNSLPITIIATNTSTATDTNVELFDTINRRFLPNPQISGTNSGVVLTTGMVNISYLELLGFLLSGYTYEFGGVRIECTYATSDSIANSDPGSAFLYQMKTAAGELKQVPKTPTVGAYQQVKNVRDVAFPIVVNAIASFKIASISASSVIRYEFYPKSEVSTASTLIKGSVQKNFGESGLNQIVRF